MKISGCGGEIFTSGILTANNFNNSIQISSIHVRQKFMQKIKHYINRYRYHQQHRMLLDISGGTGACGQDIFVAELLNMKRNGVFVDIGANDGITISNTAYLEKELNWSGIAIEPIPDVFEKLKSHRICTVLNACVTPQPGKAKFLEVVNGTDMLSTLAIHNHGLTARRLRKNAKRHNAKIMEREVDCLTFDSIVIENNITDIDFLSVDTEGGELEILRSIDFDRNPVRAISVENNYYTGAIREYLEKEGFFYVGTFKVDEIYLFGGPSMRKSLKRRRS